MKDEGNTKPPANGLAAGCVNVAVVIGLLVACGYGLRHLSKQREQAQAELAAAHKEYEAGRTAEAVAVFKAKFGSAKAEDQALIIKRVAEHEAEAGNEAEARAWIERGLKAKIAVAYAGPASGLHAQMKAKHDEAEAARAKERDERAKGVSVAVSQLWREYQDDAAAADRRYKGKTLRVTGTVTEVFPPDGAIRAITVHMEPASGNVVCCWFLSSDRAAAALRGGQSVTIKGSCEGLLPLAKEIRLKACEVIP
jgi:hypothetical protein